MNNDKPKVSVIVPTYNRAHFIKKAINTVLEQTYQDFEIIVVDDGSKDETEDVVKSIKDDRIRFIKHDKNRGSSVARNTGIKNAKGEYIAFLDSDVTWLKEKLEKQIKILESSPADVGVVFCGVQRMDYKTQKYTTQWIIRENVNEKIFDGVGYAPDTPTMFIRKSALLDVGFFDENIPYFEETELGIRLAKKYKFILIDEFLIISTMNHEQNTSSPNINHNKGLEIIYEKHNDILTRSFCHNICNIIAGESIVKGDLKKAKIYLLKAIKYKPYKLKPIIAFLLSFGSLGSSINLISSSSFSFSL